MNLSQKVVDFVLSVYRSPVLGTDRTTLEALKRAAEDSNDGMFGALNSPIAVLSFEQRVRLNFTDVQSPRASFKFPFACEIVGFFFGVTDLTTGGGIPLPINDLDVSVDINNQNYITNASGITATGGGTFVQVNMLQATIANRLHRLQLVGTSPDVGFTFRALRGAGIYNDTMCKAGMFIRRMVQKPSEQDLGPTNF